MPQAFITNTLLVIFGGTSAAATAAAIFAAQLIQLAAIQFAINAATRALGPKPPKGAGRGMELNYAESDAPGVLLYGTARLGGMHAIPPLTSGSENQDLHQAIVHCYGPISDIRDVYFDDDVIADADIAAVSGGDTDGAVSGSTKYAGFAWIRRYLGTTTENVDFILNAVSGTAFPATFRGRRLAKTIVRLRFSDKVYSTLPLLNMLADGYAVYDPRLDSTKPGGSGSHRDNDSTTWAFAGGLGSNPILCLGHFLLNNEYGGGYASSEIDWTTFQTAATACDALVNIPGSLTQPRYTCNGILLANSGFTENVTRLIDSCLGRIVFIDGQWRAYAGGWATPTFTVNREDFTGPVAIKFEGGRESRFNRARCWFVDSELKYSRKECYPRSNAAYQTADGSEAIDIEMEQPLCVNEFEAQRKAEFILRQSRNQIIVTAEVGPKLSHIGLWETGVINWDEFGWTSKTFRCVGYEISASGGCRLTFREEQEDDWDDLAAGEYDNISRIPPPDANETKPSEPQNFAVQSLNGLITGSWSNPVVRPSGTRYQFIRSPGSASAVQSGVVVWDGDTNQALFATQSYTDAWYHVRAYVGSQFSAYVPNTFGTHGRPFIDPNGALGNRAFPDGDFSFALSSYWNLPISGVWSLDSGNGISPIKGSITLTGTDGFLSGNQQAMNGTVPNLDPTPNLPKLTPGQTIALGLTVLRVESAVTNFQLFCTARHYVSKSSNTGISLVNTEIMVSSQTIGDWRTYNFTMTAPTSPVTHLFLGLNWYSAFGTAGRVRIGVLQAALL